MLTRSIRLAAVAVLFGVAGLLLAGCNDHLPTAINLVGSGTTQDVMDAIAMQYDASSQATADNGYLIDTPATLPSGSSSFVQGDNICFDFSYTNPGNLPPNGSSAGITAVENSAEGNGCTDGARSTRGAQPGDNPNDEFWAFAKDAVSWVRFTASHAPANLTQAQLRSIYECTNAGEPALTNWQQVGGTSGPIVRYLPPAGSDTVASFETKVLGLSSAQQGVLDDTACNDRPKRVEENEGVSVASSDLPNAILPFSFAQWKAQSKNVVTDRRNGALLGKINSVAPTVTTISNGMFVARYWVYNVLVPGIPASESATARKIVGMPSSRVPGYLCGANTGAQHVIAQYGFVTNPVGATGSGLPGSHCRLNPTPL
jgi:phosphate transport system substrate-binding protein